MTENNCSVCNSQEWGKSYSYFSPLNEKYKAKVSLCKVCGHGQIVPMINAQRISYNNEMFLGGKYISSNEREKAKNKKLNVLKERLSDLNLTNKKVLDIGAGEGWSIPFFNSSGAKYFAIEPIDSLAMKIKKTSGIIISSDIFEVNKKYESTFDLVVFRHIIEHLPEPAKALEVINRLLVDDGLLYIAAPNASFPDLKKGFSTSFLRPVHVQYFNSPNLVRLLELSGFVVTTLDDGKEIYILAQKKKNNTSGKYQNTYDKQKKIFDDAFLYSLKKDIYCNFKQMIKICLLKIRFLKK
ncbi:class I SAM-dependent methyltransferase [Marinomonas sp. PE14-40]|uniref:class I SAM-dependent methyltransferase n=1 Tax=Marinomonas sp. PE14-40 TaxID=3060621 RepID=UPI003F67BBB9